MGNDPFVYNEGGRWFILLNIDHEDDEGHLGVSTEYLGNPHGYDTENEAEAAMDALDCIS